MPKTLLVLIVTLGSAAAAGLAIAQEPLVVAKLVSGRQFAGAIDGDSTAQLLVVRSSADGLTIRRPIRWERISSATLDGQPLAIAELKKLALQARARESGVGVRESRIKNIELRGPPPTLMAAAEAALPPEPELPPVATIAFDTFIANWDGDVETDGLVVDLLPLDNYGNLIRASGVVEVELFASQRRTMQHAPKSGGDTFERVERWSQAVTPAEIGPNGVRLRLPSDRSIPSSTPNGWLTTTASCMCGSSPPAAASSTSHATASAFDRRKPNRDFLEMNTGRRFLPDTRRKSGAAELAAYQPDA